MRTQFIKDFEGGVTINLDFAVIRKSSSTAYKNKSGAWFSLLVSDKTGEIPVKYWGGPDEDVTKTLHSSFVTGDIISITGTIKYDDYTKGLEISVDTKTGQVIQKK